MTRPEIGGISPFFIVQDGAGALSFYRDRLGFEVTFQEPADDPFFGIVRRGGAMIMLKDVGVDPLPNHKREPMARWDAYRLCLKSPPFGAYGYNAKRLFEKTAIPPKKSLFGSEFIGRFKEKEYDN